MRIASDQCATQTWRKLYADAQTATPIPPTTKHSESAMSYRILVADPNTNAQTIAEQALVQSDCRVASVSTFDQAKRQIALDCPDLLVTALRLGAYNGLQLLLRVRAVCGDLPVIITGAAGDFTQDIERYGGEFMASPVEPSQLVARIAELLQGRVPHDPHSKRRWPRRRTTLPATVLDSSATVIELSYGGLRLELPSVPGVRRDALNVTIPTLGLSLMARPRWSRPAAGNGSWWCGAEIGPLAIEDTHEWRRIVDALS
jgi:CheY-like chemotaxis protein